MRSKDIRKVFLKFFRNKNHLIVPSAPMVIKNDPSLMFTNAGMNQFKDIFLGHKSPDSLRIANSQKCLRVSGKHNDLEEVGIDTYHHTMFEMLGNWSFGDYFKKEAIEWGWEFLTQVLGIEEDRLYATIFKGDDIINKDIEAYDIWKNIIPENRIIEGDRKDNFWEMGDIGPCGPCSEIHIDLRDDVERRKLSGKKLVNENNPLVIELWNLVFIQYNKTKNGKLEKLSQKHVDTGMGFERLSMVLQRKTSNYDTDIFQSIIKKIESISKLKYHNKDEKINTAIRVVADHIRTISFSIAEGQLPSSNKAGYVIRRILRRAVRYGYTFLKLQEPFLYQLVKTLSDTIESQYPELVKNQKLIEKVIREEEISFLKTLENGIKLLDEVMSDTSNKNKKLISGNDAFKLYDTFGFPIDLTQLIAQENNFSVDILGFENELNKQKKRSKQAIKIDAEEWISIPENGNIDNEFVGYDNLKYDMKIIKYRTVNTPQGQLYHLVFDKTPFYGESGGQVGDSGSIEFDKEKISIIDTQLEHGIIFHITNKLPKNLNVKYSGTVDWTKRELTANNHSATHLLHYALKKILGNHIEQKGSLVNEKHLTFDFSHFKKVEYHEIEKIESVVNSMIRENIPLEEFRQIEKKEALKMGAVALFGEKYGNKVRVIKFDNSVELCGGTHVPYTGQIGFFKIISESSIAAGIRRIEAITSIAADKYINSHLKLSKELEIVLNKNWESLIPTIKDLLNENKKLKKEIQHYQRQESQNLKKQLLEKINTIKNYQLISETISYENPAGIKDIAFQLKREVPNLILILGNVFEEKAQLTIMLSNQIVDKYSLDANKIIKIAAKHINGGGGGQSFFANAGGNKTMGIKEAINEAKKIILDKINNK